MVRQATRAAFAIMAALASTPALASPSVALDSAVFVEHLKPGNVRNLEPADRLSRGDRVVTVLSWRRTAGSGGFVVINPLPRTIAYQASASDNEEVSVDGGRTWGRIGELFYGTRLATPEDVTHVRWRVPAGNAGRITYSGIVR
jgi:hypothetical protein